MLSHTFGMRRRRTPLSVRLASAIMAGSMVLLAGKTLLSGDAFSRDPGTPLIFNEVMPEMQEAERVNVRPLCVLLTPLHMPNVPQTVGECVTTLVSDPSRLQNMSEGQKTAWRNSAVEAGNGRQYATALDRAMGATGALQNFSQCFSRSPRDDDHRLCERAFWSDQNRRTPSWFTRSLSAVSQALAG